ncbi:MAG: thermonuclease family protein [Cocleimonas sp.]|nr:thermonuclease family protein [Cocleimonas sp.]
MFVTFLFLSPHVASAESCTSSSLSSPESATVKWVYDGDSLLLTDKRKIRIIGIDTPETKHHRQKAQAYGAKAKEALRELLKSFNYQVTLRYGKERKDKYKRTLAHVYLVDGTNISNWLLEQGYAKTLAFPPNVALADCYKNSEEVAQAQLLKIWRYKGNQIKQASSLPRRINGYVRLRGKIAKVRHYRKSLIMELESDSKSHIQVKIKKRHLRYFNEIEPDKLWNKTIIVTGLLKNKKGKRTVYLSHSSQLQIVSAQQQQVLAQEVKNK